VLQEEFEGVIRIYRHINGEKYVIAPEEFILAGKVDVHYYHEIGEEATQVRIRGVIDSIYVDGLPQEITPGARPLSEIRQYTESLSKWTVRNIWSVLIPLKDEEDWLDGATVDVEYDQEPNALSIQLGNRKESIVTLVRPLDELFEWIRQSYGLEDGQD
jgi:hypothetical protein